MAKRGQNTGSISQRKDGRWHVRITLPDGTRRSFYEATQVEAEETLARVRREMADGILSAPGRMTVSELGALWLGAIEGSLRHNTVRGHKSRWKHHVKPVIGNVPIRAVTGAHVQRVLTTARRNKQSEGSVREIHHSMGAMFRHAVSWGLLARNPVRGVAAPPPPQRDLPINTPEQVEALLSALHTSPYRVPLLLAVTLGMRAGEVRGLRWQDIDFDAAVLHVRTNGDVQAGKLVLSDLKTKQSRRTLPIPAFLLSLLRTHRAEQNATRLRAGDTWQPHDLVVTGRYPGHPVAPYTLSRHLEAICDANDLPRITMHHLRHLCATILAMKGVPPSVVQGILGHSTPDLALRIYTHVQSNALTAAADAMEQAVGSRKEQA